jgi:hypothetical protein
MSKRIALPGGGRPVRASWVVAVAVAAAWAGVGRAQPDRVVPAGGAVTDARPAGPAGRLDGMVRPAVPGRNELSGPVVVPISGIGGCASCGTGFGSTPGPGIYGYGKHGHGYDAYGACGPDGCGAGDPGCGEAGCYPGRPPCVTCSGTGHNRFGRLFCAFHDALCCPDPCYEPKWVCAANAALFVDHARPATLTRLRWDAGRNLIHPDRSEFFWAAQGRKGPGAVVGGVVQNPVVSVDYDELSLYTEAGADRFSFWVNVPYRSLEFRPRDGGSIGAGGFGDMSIGTKSLILDSEVLQLTFQFATFIPIGNAGRGIGVGHVSLDPSLLWAVKLYTDTWWQSQLGYWIPISPTTVDGSPFAGGILHYHNTINHVIARPLCDTALVGTIESVGYTFTAGGFTDPATGLIRPANEQTYFGVGPGLRLCICDKLDVGFGILFAVTNPNFADQLYRTELRWRF